MHFIRRSPLVALLLVLMLPSLLLADGNATRRGNFANSRLIFEKGKGHVAFMGGSITEMNGYRPMVMAALQKAYPKTDFTFTNAGISSTCSTTGAMRLSRDVLSKGPVDLFFVEFAVNDDQDAGHARRECIRGLEGIICQVRKHNPNADIVVTYFVNPSMRDQIQKGKTPLTIEAHDTVAKHYNVSAINLAKEVAEQITAGKLTWKQFGGTHPAKTGNQICADMIEAMLTEAWSDKAKSDRSPTRVQAHKLPKPIDANSYRGGMFIDPKLAKIKRGWKLEVPKWKSIKGGKRSRFTSIPMFAATEPGAEATVDFEGTAVGAYMVAGPDAGILEVSVDGGSFTSVNTYHRFSRGLHYPRTVMFATDLKPGAHKLTLRISKQTKSKGTAIRIMQFVANGTD